MESVSGGSDGSSFSPRVLGDLFSEDSGGISSSSYLTVIQQAFSSKSTVCAQQEYDLLNTQFILSQYSIIAINEYPYKEPLCSFRNSCFFDLVHRENRSHSEQTYSSQWMSDSHIPVGFTVIFSNVQVESLLLL